MENNCFYNNDFLGPGLALGNGTRVISATNNYAPSVLNGNVNCSLYYDEDGSGKCIAADVTSACPLWATDPTLPIVEGAEPPSVSSPVAAPSMEAPSSSSSAGGGAASWMGVRGGVIMYLTVIGMSMIFM